MSAPCPPTASALNAASQTIRDGLTRLDAAARGVARDFTLPPDGEIDAGQLVTDIIDLSKSAQQVKLGVTIARTDQEAHAEIMNMVRHDADAQHARDTHLRPHHSLPQHTLDILV